MNVLPPSYTDEDFIRIAEKLPAAPRLLVALGQAINNPQVEAEEVTELLRQDQSLVAQIIRMANSVAYSPKSPVGSLERALATVGFAEVHRLVGLVAARQLSELTTRWYPISSTKIRQNALYVAVIMEELARVAGEKPRTCYTVGLLRTIGMLALDRLARPDLAILPFGESGEPDLMTWERRFWGVSNGEAAEKILWHWKMPHETVSAIRHHYQPAGRHNPLIHLLLLAASSAHDRFWGIPGEENYLLPAAENFAKSGVEPLRFQQASEAAQRTFDRLLMAAG